MKHAVSIIAVLAYNLALLAGCSYLVFWKGASPFWFIAVSLMLATIKSSDANK
jgi:hypothetical protein